VLGAAAELKSLHQEQTSMCSRWFVRLGAPAVAAVALLLTPGKGAAQPPSGLDATDLAIWYLYGPETYIYGPGFAGRGGILALWYDPPPLFPGRLWYWPNVHYPAKSWYMTYNAGPGGYRWFYPMGEGKSNYWSLRTGTRPWVKVTSLVTPDRAGWQFPRDSLPTLPGQEEVVGQPVPEGRLQDPSTALIVVRVPVANAEVFVEDQLMRGGQGTTRRFLSPSLSLRRNYVYTVRARWKEGGQEYQQVRSVNMRAGDTVTVDFTSAK
jgi:uncharacterized protein (TIGR03000 family)